MRTRLCAAFFDFDGVIHDSEEEMWRCSNEVLRHFGLPIETQQAFRHRSHNEFQWFVERGVPLHERPWRAHYYRQSKVRDCGLIEGVCEVLEHLRNQGVACAIVSAQRREEIEYKLHKFSIAHHFRHIVANVSPKHGAIQETCELLKVAREETLYIGDLHSDVLDSKQAGVMSVLLAPPDYPHVGHAQHHINTLAELKKLFD